MKEKGTDGVIDGSNHPLSFPVLLRSVRTREPESNAMFRKILVKVIVVIFTSIVALKRLYGSSKLCFDISREVQKF